MTFALERRIRNFQKQLLYQKVIAVFKTVERNDLRHLYFGESTQMLGKYRSITPGIIALDHPQEIQLLYFRQQNFFILF